MFGGGGGGGGERLINHGFFHETNEDKMEGKCGKEDDGKCTSREQPIGDG